ncbi:MAG: hypothetical protein LBR11_07670 [Deltaproteobacteria bacterium]|nr:hypothetical protein [Deltaproteobacteria bacterium]
MSKLIGALIFVVTWELVAPAWGDPARDFIWWKMVSQSQSPEGGHLISYRLESPGATAIEDLEVIFRVSPYQRAGAARSFGQGQYFQKIVHPGQRDFVFHGGQSAKIDIWARARRGERWLFAQTLVATFGQSGLGDSESSALVDFDWAPDWPQWRLAGAEMFYRAQAGQPLSLELSVQPRLVQVLEDQVTMANWPGRELGLYQYVSSQNHQLAQSGYTAQKKDVIFLASLGQLGEATFALPVYRAYYGQLDYKKGLTVMAAFFVGTIGLVSFHGRRFESQ